MTQYPLRERMTIFWHGHFGVSNARVNDSQLMMRHVRTLRTHALGSYRALLDGVSQDPAVFLALGADANRKAFPNERFSRQLMERFSLGPGHYGEEDVREAARAFTGWFVLRGRLRYFAHEYDAGPKRVLGQEGQWQPGDIVRIVLEQPDTPRLIARKLFRWLISEVDEPSDELIQPMAEMLGKQYDVGQVVETMLRSNVFFSEHALHRRIKSPVEYAVGLITALRRSCRQCRSALRWPNWDRTCISPRRHVVGWGANTGSIPPPCSAERISPAVCWPRAGLWEASSIPRAWSGNTADPTRGNRLSSS